VKPLRLVPPLLALSAGPAAAGDAACWWDQGRLVVAASVMGVTGDYILDTGEPRTILAETHAQKSGFDQTALVGEVKVAGITLAERPIAVVDLDARSHTLPTPTAGVIGLDVLKGFVVDVAYGGACRVRIHRVGMAPAFRARTALPMTWSGGRATIPAAVADGPTAKQGAFVPATGADAPVRLSDAGAQVEGAARPDAIYLYGDLRPRLRALSLGGELFENVPAGLVKAENLPGADGVIGAAILTRWSLRFDFPGGKLLLGDPPAHEKGPRRNPRGP
jgi:hypothetical protein